MRVKFSLLIWVVVPTIASLIYFLNYATGQYEVESRFAIRGGQALQLDALSSLSNMAGGATTSSDSYILKSYIDSIDMVNYVDGEVDLESLYGKLEYDWWSRMTDAPTQNDLLDYWQRVTDIHYDSITGILSLTVRAFEPGVAVKISETVLKKSDELVNTLSDEALNDALKLAQQELDKAEQQLFDVKAEVTRFRNKNLALDPVKSAEGKLGIITSLESELAKAEAEFAAIRSYARPSAPAYQTLQSKISGLKKQVREEELRLGSSKPEQSGGAAMTSLLDEYDSLLIKREFAEKMYASTLASLESARLEANSQQRYLTVFVKPQLPDEIASPDPLWDTLIVFLSAFLLWGIGSIAIASVKDHAGWV
ncbi:MAG: hypothetical protein ACWA5R_06105 [bacterium]